MAMKRSQIDRAIEAAGSRVALASLCGARRGVASPWLLLLVLSVMFVAVERPLVADVAPGDVAPEPLEGIDDRIAKLIEQLGADQFTIRENAQSELQRLGPAAFDALDQARHHQDVEVAMRARYLLRIMSVDWSRENDPAEVKGALKGYGDQNEAERRSRMERLGAFEGGRGVPALCRLARFESSQLLSKHAALLVMQQPLPEDPAERTALAKLLTTTADTSKRPAAAWLRLYAKTIEDPRGTVDAWQKLSIAELQTAKGSPEQTDSQIVRDLLRWQSDYLRRIDRDEDAQAAARRLIDVVDDSPTELSDLVGWLMERKFWLLVQDVAERHADDFIRSPLLLYRHAESLQRQGDMANAEKIAARASGMQPDNAAVHLEVAIDLRDRGLNAWAEREFRTTIKVGSPGDPDDIKARFRLSELLFDNRQALDAAMVWQQFVDLMEENPEVKLRYGERKQFFRSRMHYFYAEHYASLKDRVHQEEQLDLGIRHDETDADVLIAMYRLPDADERWKKRTSGLISAAAKHFEELKDRWSRIAVEQLEPEQREQVQDNLANICNQYAWLVANTEGDFDEALNCGLRAVELKPKTSSYLDTLSHCYFAEKDYANAVKYQTLAVQREPHSQQIRRQLGVFQKALERQRASEAPAKPGQDARPRDPAAAANPAATDGGK